MIHSVRNQACLLALAVLTSCYSTSMRSTSLEATMTPSGHAIRMTKGTVWEDSSEGSSEESSEDIGNPDAQPIAVAYVNDSGGDHVRTFCVPIEVTNHGEEPWKITSAMLRFVHEDESRPEPPSAPGSTLITIPPGQSREFEIRLGIAISEPDADPDGNFQLFYLEPGLDAALVEELTVRTRSPVVGGLQAIGDVTLWTLQLVSFMN